jgi:hypothetical protein
VTENISTNYPNLDSAPGTATGIDLVNAVANTNTPSGATAFDMAVYDSKGRRIGYIPVYNDRGWGNDRQADAGIASVEFIAQEVTAA